MSTRPYTHSLLALVLVSSALPVRSQGLPASPTGVSSAPSNRQADPARAARKAQLMAEFQALLEQTQARQDARDVAGSDSSGPATNEVGATRASAASPAVPPPAALPPAALPPAAPAPAAASASQAPAVRWPKDPGLDYTGFSCEYFTRPPQASSAALIHPEGSWVAYGERMYQCINQRWRMAGPAAAYADGAQRQAELVER